MTDSKFNVLINKKFKSKIACLTVYLKNIAKNIDHYEDLILVGDSFESVLYEFKKSFLQIISNKFVNSIRDINIMVYDITSKPPSTIELE